MRRIRSISRSARRWLALTSTLVIAAGALLVTANAGGTGTAGVHPNKSGELDCNGFSTIQKVVRPVMLCADVHNAVTHQRFYDNGWYIGHDEPSVHFISPLAGSGDNVTLNETLGVDPAANPTAAHPGSDVTHTFELSPAPWLSMDLCDPNSTPLTPCTPESDQNAPRNSYAGGGAAFMELQFYPPGFAPFIDNISCDDAHWCAALTIDSLTCNPLSFSCNPKCTEPVNFAFLETDGVPTGPPSPQLSDTATFTPDAHTLLMNPGDRISIHVLDTKVTGGSALEASVTDATTKQSGYAIASGANGFMTTDPNTCNGTPFNFQPLYSSAGPNEVTPWGYGAYNINIEYEIGHWESCTKVTYKGTFTIGSSSDTYYKDCAGPYETTPDKGNPLEPNDAPCYPVGDTHGATSAPDTATGCEVSLDAIGDLDYDGSPYWADWPDSTTPDNFPSATLQAQPTSNGNVYPEMQFVTDNSSTQQGCNTGTGTGCALPPPGPGHFYPYWTLAKVGGQCVWEFGNMANGSSFGGTGQYGSVTPYTIGSFESPVKVNPTGC